MSRISVFADWLRAVNELQPTGEDGLDAIARQLGLRLKDTGKIVTEVRKRRPPAILQQDEAGASVAIAPVPVAKLRRRMDSVLTLGNSSRHQAPQWLITAPHLEKPNINQIRPRMALEPLFPIRTSRAILSGALATPSKSGPLHLSRVIDLLSQAKVIQELPYLPIPTLAHGVQLLIDSAEALQPFAMDQAELRTALLGVVGRDRTQVLYFEGSPLWGISSGSKESWTNYKTPTPGTPVVALTDLGIGRPPYVAGLAGISDWREFAQTLRRASCPLVALVPYPPQRWPMSLSKLMTILQWDRTTTVAVVRRTVTAGLGR
jgi:hypothetical protein